MPREPRSRDAEITPKLALASHSLAVISQKGKAKPRLHAQNRFDDAVALDTGLNMAKNSNKNKGLQPKTSKPSPMQKVPVTVPENPAPAPLNEPAPAIKSLQMRTVIGAIQIHLFDELLRPAFISFDQRRDDEPLRQLIESIVTSIAMRDAYDGYRKIDDICQRYLYYLESIRGISSRSWEQLENAALCDYWRTQAFLTLIRESNAIFDLLLPDSQPPLPSSRFLKQDDFLNAVLAVLNPNLDTHTPLSRDSLKSKDLYDFAHGVSFPYIGFNAENIFRLQHMANDTDIRVSHEFALANETYTAQLAKDASDAINDCLFRDLIFSQHHKFYDELLNAFAPNESLPDELTAELSKKFRFDKTYQSAFDNIHNNIPITKQLHRASRLDFHDLNSFGEFLSILQDAQAQGLGVYIFHYVG